METTAINCENVITAALALKDGEQPPLSAQQIENHLKTCANCPHEIWQAENVVNLLENQKRSRHAADLWFEIENRLEQPAPKLASEQQRWQPFLLLGVLLIVYKLLEMLPESDFGFSFKLAPLIFIVGLFLLIRENPFKINCELKAEN